MRLRILLAILVAVISCTVYFVGWNDGHHVGYMASQADCILTGKVDIKKLLKEGGFKICRKGDSY